MTSDPSRSSFNVDVADPRHADLVRGVRDRRAIDLARSISLVENESPGFESFLDALLDHRQPEGARVGVTGPPGAGKSSLVSVLARSYREAGEEVGILAVDPSSPYSGGALLGDRIRLQAHASDPGVFIRSTASRGSLGGLATTSKEVLDVMGAFGFGRLIVETVGVGQSELEVTRATDSVVVVLVPESGDDVQAMKAGLMEAADIFVVNKADRPGAERLSRELRASLALRSHPSEPDRSAVESDPRASGGWTAPVLLTTSTTGEGVESVVEALAAHREHLVGSGELDRRRRARAEARIRDVVDRAMVRSGREAVARTLHGSDIIARVLSGQATPYSVAREILCAEGTPDV